MDLQPGIDGRFDGLQECAKDVRVVAWDRVRAPGQSRRPMQRPTSRCHDACIRILGVAHVRVGRVGLWRCILWLGSRSFINRQGNGLLRRIEIQAAHITDPTPELWVVASIEPSSDLAKIDIHRRKDLPELRSRHHDLVVVGQDGDEFVQRPHRHRVIR